MPLRNRLQAPEIPAGQPLRPAAQQVDTYVRPPAPVGEGNNLLRLADSLGQLRPSLQRFGTAVMQDQDKRAAEDVQAQMPLMSNKEVFDAYEKGLLPGMTAPASVADIAARKIAGARAAIEAQEDMKSELAQGTFDWEKGDINGWVHERMKRYSARFGQDRFGLSGFGEAMTGFPEKLMAERTKQATALDASRRQDNTFEAMALAVRSAIAQGATPAESFRALRAAQLVTAGPRGSQGVPLAEADKYALQIAQNLVAEGKHLDHAVAILTTDRAGPGGEHVPALVNSASHGEAVRSIIRAAATERRRQSFEADKRALLSHDVELLSGGRGKLATVGDVEIAKEDGSAHVVSARTRQENAVRSYVENVCPALAKAHREAPEQTFNRELNAVTFAGVEHPKWKAGLEAAPKAASLNELTDPTKRDSLLSMAHLYDQLREKNPLYLKGLVNKETMAFFETLRVAKTLPGRSLEDAADLARRASIDIDGDREKQLAGHYREIENNIQSANPSNLLLRVFGYAGELQNGGYLQAEVIDKAKLFARLGLPPRVAIEKAQEAVKETSVNVNGWVVPKLPGVVLPTDFPQAASRYMKDFVEKFGKINDGVTASNIGLVYDGAGTFTLVGPNGIGLRTPNGLAHFTLRDLKQHWNDTEDTARERVRVEGEKRRAAREAEYLLWDSREHFERSPLGRLLKGIKDDGTRRSLEEFHGVPSKLEDHFRSRREKREERIRQERETVTPPKARQKQSFNFTRDADGRITGVNDYQIVRDAEGRIAGFETA